MSGSMILKKIELLVKLEKAKGSAVVLVPAGPWARR